MRYLFLILTIFCLSGCFVGYYEDYPRSEYVYMEGHYYWGGGGYVYCPRGYYTYHHYYHYHHWH